MCTACDYYFLNAVNGTHDLFEDIENGLLNIPPVSNGNYNQSEVISDGLGNAGNETGMTYGLGSSINTNYNQISTDPAPDEAAEPDPFYDYGVASASNSSATGNAYIDGILGAGQWDDPELTFSFPDEYSDHVDPNGGNVIGTSYSRWQTLTSQFSEFSAAEAAQIREILFEYAEISGLSFIELDGAEGALDEDKEATIRFSQFDNYGSTNGVGMFPYNNSEDAGDVWIKSENDDFNIGTDGYFLMTHEIGHVLGLSHTFQSISGMGTFATNNGETEYTAMSYDRSASDTAGYMQSLMRSDIAAMQHMYGANYDHNSGDTVYTFSTTTGASFIDGISQGVPYENVVFRTFWDGGGIDTYDLSNYSTDLDLDLRAGEASDFDVNSNFQAVTHADGVAEGQIYNSWLYQNNTVSLIENATGGSGDDLITGNQADNLLIGNAGNDDLIGNSGDDYLVLSEGDTGSGGSGDDSFSIDANQSGSNSISITGGESGETLGDTLLLGDLLLSSTDFDLAGINYTGAESGNFTYRDSGGETISVSFSQIENVMCFTRGTMIRTMLGEVPIESLAEGDLIATKDNGFRPIIWIGSRSVAARGNLAPIVFSKGVLGNHSDLTVSPEHRMVLEGWQAEMLFDQSSTLAAAKHLVNGDTIYRSEGGEVEYFHILFDTHQIVFANGAEAESFHPGEQGIGTLHPDGQEEIFKIFPELRSDCRAYGPTARTNLRSFEARALARSLF